MKRVDGRVLRANQSHRGFVGVWATLVLGGERTLRTGTTGYRRVVDGDTLVVHAGHQLRVGRGTEQSFLLVFYRNEAE